MSSQVRILPSALLQLTRQCRNRALNPLCRLNAYPALPLLSIPMDKHWVGAPDLLGSTCSEEWVSVSNDVSLRVLRWTPDNKALQDARPLMVVPGWGSVFEGWRPLMTEWTTRRPIIYVETREKASARFTKRERVTDFRMEDFIQDLVRVMRHYDIEGSCDLFSSSLGSTILIEAMQRGMIDAQSSLFVAPNLDLKMPFWPRFFIKTPMPKFFLRFTIKMAVWAVQKKVKEEGQRVRYKRTLLSQNAGRVRLSARSLIGYELPVDLSAISVPCGIIAAESDKLHGLENIEKLVKKIPGAAMIAVPSNQYAHEPDVLVDIDKFYQSL